MKTGKLLSIAFEYDCHAAKVIFLLLTFILSYGESLATALPVRNFHKSEYGGGAQNWDFAQDSIGKVYFGNHVGMISFDGQRWQRHFLPNYSTVRSILYDDSSNRIYAGGSGEFGFFFCDQDSGIISYESLSERLKESGPQFTEIWKIHKIGNRLIFQGDYHLFIFADNRITLINAPARITNSSLIREKLYVATDEGKIYYLEAGSLSSLKGLDVLEGKRIVSVLPWKNDKILIGTSTDGLFEYDFKETVQMGGELNDFLKKNQLFSATEHRGKYLFGTVNNGAVLFSPSSTPDYINKNAGMQNNTVLNAGFDRDGNIWLCLDNGIDYVIANSRIRNLMGTNSSIGTGYSSFLTKDRMLLGTNQGLFSAPFSYENNLDDNLLQREIQGQVWSITPSRHGLFISTDAGIFNYNNGRFIQIKGPHGAYLTMMVPDHTDMALASCYDFFHLLKFNGTEWIDAGKISGTEDLRGRFIFDYNNNVWLPDWQTGIYKLKIDFPDQRLVHKTLYNHKSGLPTDRNNSVAVIGNSIIFSTEGGFYRPSLHSESTAEPYEKLNKLLPNFRTGHLQNVDSSNFVMFDEKGMVSIKLNNKGDYEIEEISGPLIYKNLVPGFASVSKFDDRALIISTQDGFVELANSNPRIPNVFHKPYVSSIYSHADSLVFSSSFNNIEPHILSLPYSDNSLRFEFAYPLYSYNDAISFSSFLENYDKEWSPFSSESSREYTKLGHGSYTLHVKVRDDSTGEESETEFRFKILPPWYLSVWAKIFYIILGVGLLVITVYFIRKKFESTKYQLEQKRKRELDQLRKLSEQEALKKDYEIASLKADSLEQEIQHKSKELSNTAMNLIKKNEILREIGAQIEMLQKAENSEEIHPGLKRNLAKLKAKIAENIEKNEELDEFNRNFDIVYQDYTKSLSSKHPNLTNSDIRLCCYIRMGLSSKEIAPLVNISAKSVEMARYRLRKKIGLNADDSLSAYLSSI